jgi:hypothetical protein
MANPDISPVGFAATEHPHSPLERRRSVGWLLFGALLVVVGIGGVATFVVQLVDPSSGPVDDAVASGRIAGLSSSPTAAARFVVEVAGPYTVWVDTDGTVSTGARDVIVAAVNCEATLADGTSTSFRGAIQGTSVVSGDIATVGSFDAPVGATAVSCRSEPFGRFVLRDQLEKERDFFVTAGSPDADWIPFVALFVGIPALILGGLAIGRGWTGSLRRRTA